jgi:2-polyprenyl-3-methyl-5-hydroxy-6-metoxy-1,4-benzoquinol methylase
MLKKHGSISMLTKYSKIFDYWTENPCISENKYFPFSYCRDLKVLEIGCGGGLDAEKLVDRGVLYTGIDLTEQAVRLTKMRIKNKGKVLVMNAEFLDFPDDYFDMVYSFGVIHHTINPANVMNEAYRVLKPNGMIYIMLYNKFSIRYLLDIMFLRKILWWLHHPKYNEIRKDIPSPNKKQWVAMNTDTLGCPIANVYSKKESYTLMNRFHNIHTCTTNFGWFRMLYGLK